MADKVGPSREAKVAKDHTRLAKPPTKDRGSREGEVPAPREKQFGGVGLQGSKEWSNGSMLAAWVLLMMEEDTTSARKRSSSGSKNSQYN